MTNVDDFIILNCFGTLTNMMINSEILELTKRHIQNEEKTMESILNELKILNRGKENGRIDKL